MRALALLLLLAACGGGGGGHVASTPTPVAVAWEAGPTLAPKGNYSAGTLLTETPDALAIDIPQQGAGSTHYITRTGSLAGMERITMRYRVEMAEGVRIVPVGFPQYQTGRITLYFQRRGDDWSCKGKFDPYRWYATFSSQVFTGPGEFEMTAPLDGAWTGCEATSRASNPGEFAAAVNDTAQVGFVLGGGDGYGHGVLAVGGPARIIVTGFEVTK